MSEWNSLEVAKLAVGVLTPLLLLGLGWVLNTRLKRIEHSQWSSQKFIEKRLALYEDMAPKLNDLFCFFSLVGNFRDISPPAAVALKRDLDKAFFVNRFLLSERFQESYEGFMHACYETWRGTAQHARLRASAERQRVERGGAWDDDWLDCFSLAASVTPLPGVREAYERVMRDFAAELGATSR